MNKFNRQNTGFTIVELMIATLVFSVILLIATYGIINIGRLYRKSLTSNQTQQTARSIIDTVSQNIKFNSGPVIPGVNSNFVYCLGSGKRLSFLIDGQVKRITGGGNTTFQHGFVIDDTPCNNTTQPQAFTYVGTDAILGKELLAPGMRITKFYICYPSMQTTVDCTSSLVNMLSSDLYYINVKVVYGDDDLLSGSPKDCKQSAGREFCASSELSTYVQKVVQ